MYNFYLPNFYEEKHFKLNVELVNTLERHPEYFYNDIKIAGLYGCFPSQIWNGGRCMPDCSPTIDEIKDCLNYWDFMAIPVRFTYTNCAINKKHLSDLYCNEVTKLANNVVNEIIVNSSMLEEYLRETYPNYKFISSTTKCIVNVEDILEEIKKYYLVVLDYRFNFDDSFLENFPAPEKLEILINPCCGYECNRVKEHYELMSYMQIDNNIEDTIIYSEGCEFCMDILANLERGRALTRDRIEWLYSKGYRHFKIEGRTNIIVDMVETYVYYMIKPEYKDKVRVQLLKASLI